MRDVRMVYGDEFKQWNMLGWSMEMSLNSGTC